MTAQTMASGPRPRRIARSIGALVAGFLTVVVLSLGTDQLMHVLGVYPPWGQTMYEPALNVLALSYRIVYTILGSAARADAPRLGAGFHRAGVRHARRDRHDPDEPGAGVVSGRDRAHRLALRLAGRRAVSQTPIRTIGTCR